MDTFSAEKNHPPLVSRPGRLKALGALLAVLCLFPVWAQAASGIRDAEIEAYLDEISAPLLSAAGLEPGAVDIFIINDATINAFVTRGQRMYFHTGLLMAADTPLELKGVVAHEAGHIAGGHIARTQEAFEQASRPLVVSFGLGILAAVAGAPDLGAALLLGGQQVVERSLLSYTRTQESAADLAAARFLTETGQSVEGLYDFLDNFRDMEVLSTRSQDPFLRTHPLSTQRMATLQNIVETSPFRGRTDSPDEIRRLEMIHAKLFGFLKPPDVTFREYGESDLSKAARYARSIAYFRLSKREEAIAQLESLLVEEPLNAYFHELMGQIYFETGAPDLAVGPHSRAVELAPDVGLLRLNLATALLAQRQADTQAEPNYEALKHLRRVLLEEPGNAFAWRQQAIAHGRLGNVGEAQLATAERHFAQGQWSAAADFANRARRELPQGSTAYNRASDILGISQRKANQARNAGN